MKLSCKGTKYENHFLSDKYSNFDFVVYFMLVYICDMKFI